MPVRVRSPGDPGDAEVDELRLAARGDQDVLGLDVAVDDAVAVGVGERGGGVGADLGDQAVAELAARGRGRAAVSPSISSETR